MKISNMLIFLFFNIFMVNHVFSQSLKFEKINWNGKQVDASSDFINVQLKDNFNEKILSDFLKVKGLSIDTAPDFKNFARIKIDLKSKSLLIFIDELKKSGLFEFVEPDFIVRASVTPNDTYYSNQYALPKVNAPNAWDITTGDENIIIGILDSGIPILNDNLSHPDLQNSVRIIEGVDYVGDGNGVKDERGHGTHVAGIVGAETDNNTGVAGINWNSKLRINQVFDESGNGTHSGFRSALYNAVDNGCKIINFSGGGMTGSWYLEDAVQYAQNNNVLLVASAGNIDESNPTGVVEYPAAYSVDYANVIAVSSTTSGDVIASSSSRGSEVVVSSPGDHIYSTMPNYEVYFNTQYGLSQNYEYLSGTSMAAPLVAGLAGLMLSINPDLPPDETREILEITAVDLGTSGFDILYGHGRINASHALAHILAYDNNSLDQTATAFNGGRRLVRDIANSYHMVFSTGGAIYYRKNIEGSSWEDPILLSDGNNNNFPCITLHNTGDLYVVWQKEIASGTYDINFAMSWDNGANWYSQDKYVLTTINANKDPLPVIQADFNGNRKMVVLYTTQGLKSYRTILKYPYLINWYEKTFSGTTSNDFWPTIADEVYYGNVENVLAYTYNRSAIYYRYYAGGLWSNAINLSSIIPGSRLLHETPSISAHPSGSMIHVAWHMFDGSKHKIIHRKAYSYNNWPSVYYITYYEKQARPSISAMAGNNVNLIFQMENQNSIYKMHYSGTYWSYPTYIANGQYPSILTGSTSAKYIWTQGYVPPYEVKLSSEILTKSSSSFDEKYYSRSIAWLDSSGAFLEIQLNKMKIKMKDGTEEFISFKSALSDSNILANSNSWNYLSSDLTTVSANVESLIVDYTYEAVNMERLLTAKSEIGKININILDKDNNSIINSSLHQLNPIGNISRKGGKFRMALNPVIFIAGLQFKINLNVENLKSKPGIFASLGHIYDFTGITKENVDKNLSIINDDKLTISVYPNPFNPVTTISYQLPKESFTNLSIYNALGQKIETLVNKKVQPGYYSVQWDGSKYSSGLYFYKLTAGEYSTSGKCLLLK